MKKKTKRLQNYKKCVGCHSCYDLDCIISKCNICGCKQFIACTDYKIYDE